MRVEYLLRNSTRRSGDRIAVVAGRHSHTYATLDRQSDRFAGAIAAQGVRVGERIAVFLEDGLPAVVTAFGILKAGAVLAPLDAAADAETLARWLASQGVVGLVTESRLAARAAAALRESPAIRFVVLVGGDRASARGTCLAFEEIVGRLGAATAAPVGASSDAAALFARQEGPADSVTHSEIIAAAEFGAPDAAAAVDQPLSSRDGFHRLVATIAAGGTQVLSGRAAGRAAQPGHGAIALPRRLALVG